jgi:hypothetical protein
VVATDPDTGESEPQKVVATIVGRGEKDLVEVTVDVDGEAGDATETITATAEHSFWVDEHGRLLNPAVHGLWGEAPGWYDAEDLDPGDQLRTPDGEKVRVVDVRTYTATTTVHNLTINGVHTYHVLVGGRAVLTHNDKDGKVYIYTKDGDKYILREHANSHEGWNLDRFASGKKTVKIRLGGEN